MAPIELLSNQQMARADALAMAAGIPGLTLMENAGEAVAGKAAKMVPPGSRIHVLCGPGNNGGDGFWAARLLHRAGYEVEVSLLGDREALTGDAAEMSLRWTGSVGPLEPGCWRGADLVIDAVFGAGLTRPLAGTVAAVVEEISKNDTRVLAVDVPSGVNGSTGETAGPVFDADATVTFFRRKPGHLLYPGRARCGATFVADIGIPNAVLDEIKPMVFANSPALWRKTFPWRDAADHKYDHGHAVVVSGPLPATGAARMGAHAALRVGAGLVTVASPADALAVNAAHLTAVMLRPCDGAAELTGLLMDKRLNAVLLGPGTGVDRETCLMTEVALGTRAAVVLDADALTSFARTPGELFHAIATRPEIDAENDRQVVLTPHDGEFARLFAGLTETGNKLERARKAAELSGATIVLKGPDTVVAAADGRAAINENAPAWLATAGSGDVLAGMIAGLLAQHMPAFEAACAGVWLHGACAARFGTGLIAEDLDGMLPAVLRELASNRENGSS